MLCERREEKMKKDYKGILESLDRVFPGQIEMDTDVKAWLISIYDVGYHDGMADATRKVSVDLEDFNSNNGGKING